MVFQNQWRNMVWPLIIIPVVLLWAASVFRIFYASTSLSNSAFLKSGGAFKGRNVLLVVAHPDDESMFFSPIINYLSSNGHILHIICMSTGNANGMGNTRTEELYSASAVLKIPHRRVKIVDLPELQDGFGKVWDRDLLAELIQQEVINHDINLIISFDSYGVSGHCNHQDVHHGLQKLPLDCMGKDIEVWELVSKNIFRKYSGAIDVWLSIFECGHGSHHCILNMHPGRSFLAMSKHSSQWVWFRKLFVIFSSYTYVNTVRRM